MPGPSVDPERLGEVWTLHVQGATGAEISRRTGLGETTVSNYIRKGREAEALSELAGDRAHMRTRNLAALDALRAWGADVVNAAENRYDPDLYAQIAPHLLRTIAEQNKMLGLYAASKVSITDDRDRPRVSNEHVDAVARARARAERQQQDIDRRAE
ncbi:MAG: hypothetical protein ACRCZP_17565 [Phycicoccus sp.]